MVRTVHGTNGLHMVRIVHGTNNQWYEKSRHPSALPFFGTKSLHETRWSGIRQWYCSFGIQLQLRGKEITTRHKSKTGHMRQK